MEYIKYQFNGTMQQLHEKHEEIRAQYLSEHERNNRIYEEKLDQHKLLIEIAIEVYGQKGKQVCYLKNEKPQKPRNLRRDWDSLNHKYERWLRKEQAKVRQRENKQIREERRRIEEKRRKRKHQEYQQRYKERQKAAYDALQAAGIVEGYSMSNAISFAHHYLVEIEPNVWVYNAQESVEEDWFGELTK